MSNRQISLAYERDPGYIVLIDLEETPDGPLSTFKYFGGDICAIPIVVDDEPFDMDVVYCTDENEEEVVLVEIGCDLEMVFYKRVRNGK